MFSKDAEVRRLLMSADPGNLVNQATNKTIYISDIIHQHNTINILRTECDKNSSGRWQLTLKVTTRHKSTKMEAREYSSVQKFR